MLIAIYLFVLGMILGVVGWCLRPAALTDTDLLGAVTIPLLVLPLHHLRVLIRARKQRDPDATPVWRTPSFLLALCAGILCGRLLMAIATA